MLSKIFTNKSKNALFERFKVIAQGLANFHSFHASVEFFRSFGYFTLFVLPVWFLILYGCESSSSSPERDLAENVITIDDSELDEQYKASDIFENLTLIPLETTDESLIGSINKILIIDTVIYIMDAKSKAIMLFNTKGKYITKIVRRGAGPNEYIELNDFTVLTNGDIVILDARRILHFKADGTPFQTHRTDFGADAIEPLNDSVFVFSGGGLDDKDLNIWNYVDNKTVNSFFDHDWKHAGRIFKPLIKYEDKVYFRRYYSSTIYKVSPEQLSVQWFIDFGKRNINEDIHKLVEFYNAPVIRSSAANMYRFTETKNFVTFSFQVEDVKDGMPYYVYYSKSSGKKIITIFDTYTDDMAFDKYPPGIVDATPSEEFINILRPEYYLNFVMEKDTATMDNATKARWKYVRETTRHLGDFDNPIVALYKLKSF